MAKRENKVIYLYLKVDGSRHFYGCLASLYEQYTVEDIGISYASLRNYKFAENKLYENDKCIIVKATIIPKPNSRTLTKNQDENK